ncbi:DUF362 domain-containing protein [candidate division KSB1 bacterium]|nr:DUF362 domain-containing protein [candidate division KSB1 bacterium]
MNRRAFLHTTIASIMAAYLFGGKKYAKAARQDRSSTVVMARIEPSDPEAGFNALRLQSVLDRALESLTGLPSPAAWKQFISPNDVVGLKVNALAGKGLSTSKALVEAVCNRLQDIGIPAGHIIIFDRMDRDLQRAGYVISTNKKKPQCYGNDRVGFDHRIYEYGAAGSRITRLVTDICTAIINLPIMKDHGIVGVSGALKNLFGLIDNPNKYHDNVGDPFVADVALLKPIRDKVRLTICDALTAQYEGGPPYMPHWTWPMNTLIAATDMVAMDRIIWDIIEEKRREKRLPTLREAGREPTYIATAADRNHNLGHNELNNINVIKI